MKERITLTDNFMSAMLKMAEGNPGAITALSKMVASYAEIDPQSAFGGFTPLISLDTHHIYGSEIWILYKDVCDMDVVNVATLLRAVQLGITRESVMKSAIRSNSGLDIDFADLRAKVKAQLKNFDLKVEADAEEAATAV